MRLAPVLELGDADLDFFLLIVQRTRAGSTELRRHFDRQIEYTLRSRLNLNKRLGAAQPLTAAQQAEYYRRWTVSAIHMMLTVPEFQTKAAIADRLKLPIAHITRDLEFLVEAGLATESSGRFKTTTRRIHLSKDSPNAAHHHANWRLRAIDARVHMNDEDTSYSSVVTLAKSDSAKIRQMIADFIESSQKLIHESPEEEIFAFCIDFFRV